MTGGCISSDVFERLRQVLKDDPAGIRELYGEYLSDARQVLEQLRQATEQQNAPAMRDRAHYLKGSSMVVGARQIVEHCSALERMGKNAEFEGASELVELVEAGLTAVEVELETKLRPAEEPAKGSAA